MNFKVKSRKQIQDKVFVTITVDYNDGDYIKETTEMSVSDFGDVLPEIKTMISDCKRDHMGNYDNGKYPYQLWLNKARSANGDDTKKALYYLLDMQPHDPDDYEHGHSLILVEAVYYDDKGVSWDVIIY